MSQTEPVGVGQVLIDASLGHAPQFMIYTMLWRISTISKGHLMQVAKWGNSLAVRLPASVVEALELKEGEDIEIHVVGRRVVEIERKPTPRELVARLRKFRGRLPADFRFDRLEANERLR